MQSKPVGVLLACLLLVTASSAAVAADETTISKVELQGSGLAIVEDNTTFVWQSETATVDVTVTTGNVSEPNHQVCVRAPSLEDGQQELGCEYQRLKSNATTTVSVPLSGLPDDAVDSSLSLEVTLTQALTDTDVDDANTSVTVLTKDGQFDGDQLSNEREVELGTDLSAKDTDGDGLWDGQEVNDVGSSPLSKDTDDDGVRDAIEVDYGTDPTVEDTDDDGLSDDEEINQYDTDALDRDTDDDGLSDGREVNELDSSPTEVDTDNDGLDDATELEVGTGLDNSDTDDDGLTDGEEYNQYDTNPLESDTDGDGISDGREVYELDTNPHTAGADSDGDLLSDTLELQLGTDPGNAFSPWGYVAVLLGAGALVGLQGYRAGWRVRRQPRVVRGRTVSLPVVTRHGRHRRQTESTQVEDAESVQTSDTGPGTVSNLDSTDQSTAASPASVHSGSKQVADRHSETAQSGETSGNPASGERADVPNDQPDLDVEDSASEQLDIPDQAFLTDADRVTELLREAGGNCRQQDIVRETGWSKSKVSRLLSQMADDDEIRKISLGRENVIVLPGEEPDAVRSALDDE